MRKIAFVFFLLILPFSVIAQDEVALTFSGYPSISHDGNKVAFVSDAKSTYDIWIVNRDGTSPTILTPWQDSSEEYPDWSPDGTSIVFSSTKGTGSPNIWVINSDGSNPRSLTTEGNNEQPKYSPDGSLIAFISNRTGKNELWTMRADGSDQRAVSLISLRISDPSWSPDGTTLVYVGTKAESSNLFSIRLDGTESKQLTEGYFEDWCPDWGQQGIVFASNRDGFQGLWLVQPDGSSMYALTSPSSTGELFPRWDYGTGGVIFTRSATSETKALANIVFMDQVGSESQLTNIRGFILDGDINSDSTVDCSDVKVIKNGFGSKRGDLNFDVRADVNNDGIINIRDLSFVTQKLPAGTRCQ